jgi:RNA polymerase sigma factor (TIGR02999 family)
MLQVEVDPAPRKGVPDWFSESYERLRRVARRELGRMHASTLDTTALVHELYLKICSRDDLGFAEARKFFSYAATAMRHVLIDRANRQLCLKMGFGAAHVSLDDSERDIFSADPITALQLDAGLNALDAQNKRAAKVVELHYFAGLSLEHVACLLGVVRRTVDRDWRFARAFLLAHVK